MLKSQLLGNIGRDAETRHAPDGVAFVTFNVCKQARKPAPGQAAPAPVWVSCTWHGDRAAKVAPYLTKGTKVFVAGDLSLRTWKGRDGGDNCGLAIKVDHVEFAGGAAGGERPAGGGQREADSPPPVRDLPGQQRMPGMPGPDYPGENDEVPF